MPITVRIPTPLRKLTNELDIVTANESGTLAEIIDALERDFPGLKERLCDETGQLRRGDEHRPRRRGKHRARRRGRLANQRQALVALVEADA
jgi:molybdopterin converting factor small subunit